MTTPFTPSRTAAEIIPIDSKRTEAQVKAQVDRELRQLSEQLIALAEACQRLRATLL
jgi:hypothetical protein